jgi:hypothetical protein
LPEVIAEPNELPGFFIVQTAFGCCSIWGGTQREAIVKAQALEAYHKKDQIYPLEFVRPLAGKFSLWRSQFGGALLIRYPNGTLRPVSSGTAAAAIAVEVTEDQEQSVDTGSVTPPGM